MTAFYPWGNGTMFVALMNNDASIKQWSRIDVPQDMSLTSGALFGLYVSPIGDIDEDGIVDIVVSAHANGVNNDGSLFVLTLNRNATIKSWSKIDAFNDQYLNDIFESGVWFGSGALGIDDVDGDGIPDIIAGAMSVDGGTVLIGCLHRNMTMKSWTRVSRITMTSLADEQTYTRIAVLSNGYAAYSTSGTVDAVFTFELNMTSSSTSGNSRLSYIPIHEYSVRKDPWLNDSLPYGDSSSFAYNMINIGDLDGNGVDDIAISEDVQRCIYIAFMNDSSHSHSQVEVEVDHWRRLCSVDIFVPGYDISTFDQFGRFMSGIGDLNHDGIPDLCFGLPNVDAVVVAFMNSNGTVRHAHKIDSSDAMMSGLITAGAMFGTGIASGGDIDGDGVLNLVIGQPYYNFGMG